MANKIQIEKLLARLRATETRQANALGETSDAIAELTEILQKKATPKT